MLNKNYLFLFFSIFIGFIVAIFYSKKLNKKFIFIFLILSILLYILFYFLGDDNEKFKNSDKTITIRNYLSDGEEEENIQEESAEEEIITYKESTKTSSTELNTENNKSEESQEEETSIISTSTQPDINKFLMSNPVPTGPLNINISYNSQNSVNDLGDNKLLGDLKNRNLGKFSSCTTGDCSRIYNNSDWLYGNQAWTNDPDYYIPKKEEKNIVKEVSQNELVTSNKYRNNNEKVCPLMINTPWTEYKSGDSEPEPYNL